MPSASRFVPASLPASAASCCLARSVSPAGPRHTRRGSVAVEFGLSLPVLVTITAALIDWGEFFSGELVVVSALRDAARSAIQAEDPVTTGEARLRDALTASGLDGASAEVSGLVTNDPALGLDVLTLSVTVPRDSFIGLVVSPDELRAEMTVLLEPP